MNYGSPFLRVIFGFCWFVFALTLCTGCQAVKTQEPIQLKMLVMDDLNLSPETISQILDEYHAGHPGIRIQVEYAPAESLHDQAVAALGSNPVAIDIVAVDNPWYPEFVKSGYLLDLTDRITVRMQEDIFGFAWNATTLDDHIYGLPWVVDQKYFYYNSVLLHRAGFFTPPSTWEEVIDQARVIREKGVVEYPLVWSWAQSEASIYDWVTLLTGNGGDFLTDTGQPRFNDAAGVDTLSWMVSTLQEQLSNPDSVNFLEEDVTKVFAQGKAVFAINWFDQYRLTNLPGAESQVVGQVEMSLMPVFAQQLRSGVESATVNGTVGISIAASSPNPDPAWDFIHYLTSEEVQMKYTGESLPIWQSSFEGVNMRTMVDQNPNIEDIAPIFNQQQPYAHLRPQIPYYSVASPLLQEAIHVALAGEMSPQDALNRAAEEWQNMNLP